MSSNTSITNSLDTIYLKLSSSQTYHDALDDFKSLIKTHTSLDIAKEFSMHFTSITIDNKDICHLFPLFFSFNKDHIEILTILLSIIEQSLIEANTPLFSFIAKSLGETIHELYQSSTLLKANQDEAYKLILQLCLSAIYNSESHCKAAGLLFLSEFIENCQLIKRPPNLKFVWKTLGRLLDNKDYQFKLEALNCLLSLIFATETGFQLYACEALFKILDYLTHSDWLIRKLSLNVVYSLSFYCMNEIMPLKENIIEFLNVLKYDKVKEIEEVCIQTLKFYQDDKGNNKANDKDKDKKGKSNNNKGVLSNIKGNKANKPNMPHSRKRSANSNGNGNGNSNNTSVNDKTVINKKNNSQRNSKGNSQNNSNSNKAKSNIKPKEHRIIKGFDIVNNDFILMSNTQKTHDQMLLDSDILKYNSNSTSNNNNTQTIKRDSFFSNKHSSSISKCNDDLYIPFSTRFTKSINRMKGKEKPTHHSMHIYPHHLNNNDDKDKDNTNNNNNDNYNTINIEHRIDIDNDKLQSDSMPMPMPINPVLLLSHPAEKKIEEIIEQIKSFTETQLTLQSTVDRIELKTMVQYDQFNIRLSTLEQSFNSFTTTYYEATQMKEIEAAIKANDINKAISLSIDNSNLMLQTMPLIRQRLLSKVPQETVENYLLKAITVLEGNSIGKEKDIEIILNFILQVYNEKIGVKYAVRQLVRDAMIHYTSDDNNNDKGKDNIDNDNTISESIHSKIKIIISHSTT